jgi:hypothetical protein
MIVSLKSKFSLFRHSEVLRLRRELRRERKERDEERKAYVDYIAMMRNGKPVHREPQQHKEPSMEGQYVPPGHPSRRASIQAVPTLAPEETAALDRFRPKEAESV